MHYAYEKRRTLPIHRNAAKYLTSYVRSTYQAGARHHCCPLTTANRYQPRYFFTLSHHTYISEIPIEIGSALSLSLSLSLFNSLLPPREAFCAAYVTVALHLRRVRWSAAIRPQLIKLLISQLAYFRRHFTS